MIAAGILPLLVQLLKEKEIEIEIKNLAVCVLKEMVNKSSPEFAQEVVNNKAVPPLVTLLALSHEELRTNVILVMGQIASHNISIAQECVDRDILVRLIFLHELDVVRDLAGPLLHEAVLLHADRIAQQFVDNAALDQLARLLANPSTRIRKPVIGLLREMLKHNAELVQQVADRALPQLVHLLQDADTEIRGAVIILLMPIVKHSEKLMQQVADRVLPQLVRMFRNKKRLRPIFSMVLAKTA